MMASVRYITNNQKILQNFVAFSEYMIVDLGVDFMKFRIIILLHFCFMYLHIRRLLVDFPSTYILSTLKTFS